MRAGCPIRISCRWWTSLFEMYLIWESSWCTSCSPRVHPFFKRGWEGHSGQRNKKASQRKVSGIFENSEGQSGWGERCERVMTARAEFGRIDQTYISAHHWKSLSISVWWEMAEISFSLVAKHRMNWKTARGEGRRQADMWWLPTFWAAAYFYVTSQHLTSQTKSI